MTDFARIRQAVLILILIAIVRGAAADEVDPARVPQLIEQLASDVATTRARAARDLAVIGPEAKAAVPKLITLMNDQAVVGRYYPEVVTVQREVCSTLLAIGSEAVRGLTQAVQTGDEETARAAAFILRQIGPRSRAALPVLANRMNDAEPFLRRQLVNTVTSIDTTGDTAIPLLKQWLQDDDAHVRAEAALGLGTYGQKSASVVNALLASLNDPEAEVRGRAAQSLGRIGADADQVVPALEALLMDRGEYHYAISNHFSGLQPVVDDAAEALATFGRAESVDALITAARDLDVPTYGGLVSALGGFGVAAEKAIPLLVEHVREGHGIAGVALARLGPNALSSVPELTELLASPEDDVRLGAALALVGIEIQIQRKALHIALEVLSNKETGDGNDALVRQVLFNLGPDAAPAIPALMKDLEGEYSLNLETAQVLGRIGPAAKEAGPILIKYLGDRFDGQYVAEALGGIGPEMIPLLMTVIHDPDQMPEARTGAAATLGQFGSSATDAVPLLLEMLTDDSLDARIAAASSIGRIGSHPDQAVPSLIKLLQDPRPAVRAQAAASLGNFGNDAPLAVPALVEALTDEYLDVRASAAAALGNLGAIARPALPALRRAVDDPDHYVSSEAEQAIENLNQWK